MVLRLKSQSGRVTMLVAAWSPCHRAGDSLAGPWESPWSRAGSAESTDLSPAGAGSTCLGRQDRAASPEPGTAALSSDFKIILCMMWNQPVPAVNQGRFCFCAPGESSCCSTSPPIQKGSGTQSKSVSIQSLEKEISTFLQKVRKISCVATRTVLRSQG